MAAGPVARSARAAFALAAALLALAACGPSNADTAELTVSRADLRPRPEPLTIGVGVHFGIGDRGYDPAWTAARIDEMGFTSYRDDLVWPLFDADGARPEDPQPRQLFDFMRRTKARPVLILGHGHPGVPGGDPPLTDEGRRAFADFARRAVAATRGFDPIYEIWNEWNLTARFTMPFLVGPGAPDDPRAAVHYAALAKAAVPAVEAASANSPVLVGAVGIDQGWGWTEALVGEGALVPPARLSVHLYNHCDPDPARRNATEMIDRLEALQTSLAAKAGGPVPIAVTEFGWPTAERPCRIGRQDAADNTAQMLLWAAATPWLDGAWIYELKDQGRDPSELEANFGLFDADGAPKPAACAAREAIALVRGAKTAALHRPLPDLFVLALDDGEALRLVAWTSSRAQGATLNAKGATLAARPLCGQASPASDAQDIGPTPVVLTPGSDQTLSLTLRRF